MTDILDLRLFGPHRLDAGGSAVAMKTRRSWALLAYLASNHGRQIPRDEIATLLWDRSQQEQARASLRQELSNLRSTLRKVGWTPIEADKNSVRFEPGDASIDILDFERAARAGDSKALAAICTGPFLRDLPIPSEPFEAWRSAEARRYADRAIDVHLAGMRATREAQSVGAAAYADSAKAILAIDQSNEGAHRALMRHYATTGREGEALRQFKRCESALRRELDVAPSQATLDLLEDVKAGRRVSEVPVRVTAMPAAQHGAPVAAAATSRARGSVSRFLVSALVAFGVIAAGTTAVAGVQYVSAGQRLTRHNIICALPFLRRGAENVVTIGAIMPREMEHGERLEWGMRRFLRDKRNEYPFAFRISIEDSSPGLEALPDIFRAFEREGVKAVVGPLESRKAWEAKRWGNQEKVPIVSPLASASYLARSGGVDYFFRVGMSDGVRAKALVQWLKMKGLEKNPYVIHELPKTEPEPGDPEIYGQSQATAVKAQLDSFEETTFIRGDKESQLKAAEFPRNDGRAVMIHGYTSNIVTIVRAMQERGVRNPIFLMGVVTERLQGANFPFPEQLHVVTNVVSEARNLVNSQQLREMFEAEADSRLEYDISAYYAYDAMGMILDAVAAARRESCGGYASPAAVAEALRRTPSKRRKVLHTGFLPDTQEVHFESDGLRMLDGKKFVPVGIGG